jgi:hypothetical protein
MPRFSRILALSPLAFLLVSSCGVICIPEPPYMLSNICVRFPRELCAVRHPGCEESGIGFDAELCEARVLASCAANVEAVHRNEMTFDADEVKACLVSLSPQSNAAISDLHAALVGKGPCARIFQGKLGPLDRCDRDEQCAQPEPRDQIAGCNRDQRCEVVRVLRAGESCKLDNEGNHHCAAGLACQLPITEGDPDIGTCVEQLELGARCNPINDRLRCGRDATCDGETQLCVPRRPMGSRCFTGSDCLSGHCTDQLCGPNTTLFTPLECGQPCLGNLCD